MSDGGTTSGELISGDLLDNEERKWPASSDLTLGDLSKDEARKLRAYMRVDEWGQTWGLMNVMITTGVVFRGPQFYWLLHMVKSLYYIPVRFVRFRRDNAELYLLDFCYVATYITVIWCLLGLANWWRQLETAALNPLHQLGVSYGWFFRAGFTFAGGSLGWSVIIFRNSMVLHSVDHMTSVFIHLSPVVLFWCLRWGGGFGISRLEGWFPNTFDICRGADAEVVDQCLTFPKVFYWCDACPGTIQEFVVYPAALYLIVWAIPYYLLVFVIFKGAIKRNKKETLYDYLMTDPSMSAFVRKFPEPCWPMAYILQHFIVMVISGALTIVFWHNFIIHSAFCGILTFMAIRNGSTYTFRVFGMRYAQNLLSAHADSIRDLRSADDRWL